MKLVRGPRPWSIHAFALLSLAIGIAELVEGLVVLDVSHFQSSFPTIPWNRDWVIVYYSAMFSIVLIPLVAIWAFASRIARIIVTVFFAVALPWDLVVLRSAAMGALLNPLDLTIAIVRTGAIVLLYLPASSRWLATDETRGAQIFE